MYQYLLIVSASYSSQTDAEGISLIPRTSKIPFWIFAIAAPSGTPYTCDKTIVVLYRYIQHKLDAWTIYSIAALTGYLIELFVVKDQLGA